MPWTPKQTRYLLSSGSPLSGGQKDKMKSELHADPSLAHRKKGTPMPAKKKKYSDSDDAASPSGMKIKPSKGTVAGIPDGPPVAISSLMRPKRRKY